MIYTRARAKVQDAIVKRRMVHIDTRNQTLMTIPLAKVAEPNPGPH